MRSDHAWAQGFLWVMKMMSTQTVVMVVKLPECTKKALIRVL